MSDLTKILAENQEEMLKLIAPWSKKQPVRMNNQDPDSEPENISVARTSTPVKKTNATNSKTSPTNSRNTFQQESLQKIVISRQNLFHCQEYCFVIETAHDSYNISVILVRNKMLF